MNTLARHEPQSVSAEWLAAYVAGSLSDAKSLVVACQAAMKPKIARHLSELEILGGMLMESASGAQISDDFIGRLMGALDGKSDAPFPSRQDASASQSGESWMPLPLRRYLEETGVAVNWRFAGPGIERAPLAQAEDGERLYLLKARGGFEMPVHSHYGEEWTLILKGAYHVGDNGYVVGDLHREDETCTHQPIIDKGEECICLVAIDGKLKFKQTLLKALQPLLGV